MVCFVLLQGEVNVEQQLPPTNHDRLDNSLLLPPPVQKQLQPPPITIYQKIYISYFEGTNNEENDEST